MAVVHTDMVDPKHRSDLFDDGIAACLDSVETADGLNIVGVDFLVVDEIFGPAAVEVDPLGLDFEFGQVVVFDQVGFLDTLDLVDNGLL